MTQAFWLDIVQQSLSRACSAGQMVLRPGRLRVSFHPPLDGFLVLSLIGLAFTEFTVISFHLAFAGVLIAALCLPWEAFAFRAVVIGVAASLALGLAVQTGRAFAEELWEIPLMGMVLAVAYGMKWQRELALRGIDQARFRAIAGVAHDIRNPLTAVLGFSDSILRVGAAAPDDETLEMVGLIAGAAREANELIEDLLTASRLEVGELEIAAEVVNVTETVRQLTEHHRRAGHEIRVRLDGGEMLVGANELRVRQILRNLLSNALRYGGLSVEVRLNREQSAGLLQVIDDGSGIPVNERDRVFEPFIQGHRTDRPTESVGLGLYTSRRLAELMDGSLTYRYEGGRSIFELRLPLAPAESLSV